jgi:3-methyladenine DNA glycosylase AlkD
MTYQEIIKELKSQRNLKNIEGMARFGINPKGTLGISIPYLRKLGKKIGKNHDLALQLWNSKIHEARILAAFVDEPEKVTEKQIESWAGDFDSWDVCDMVCGNLFDQTPFAYNKAFELSSQKEEFVKRTGFVLMAALAVHDKKIDDKKLMKFFPVIIRESTDKRNFVRKAVNWALRQIGKRNQNLKKEAIKTAEEILRKYPESKSAKWVAKDVLRELALH